MTHTPPHSEAQKYCCICETAVDSFIPWKGQKNNDFVKQFQNIGSDTNHFTCPNCRCHDRMRHLHLFMEKMDIYSRLEDADVLYIAPEVHIYNKIRTLTHNIIAGDFHPDNYRTSIPGIMRIDLARLTFAPEMFDAVIANHVLEHIVDYKYAMGEMYRVLKRGGFAIVQTPYSPIIYNNFEDPLINTDALREQFYGQADHVRIFGQRFFDDLISAGFDAYLIPHDSVLAEFDPAIYGVNQRESFMLALKPVAGPDC